MLEWVGAWSGRDVQCWSCVTVRRPQLQSRRHLEQQRQWDADAEARQQRQKVAELNRKNCEVSALPDKPGDRPAAAAASGECRASAPHLILVLCWYGEWQLLRRISHQSISFMY